MDTKEIKQKDIQFWIFVGLIGFLVLSILIIGICVAVSLANPPQITEPTIVTEPSTEPSTEPATEPPPPSLPDIPMNRYMETDFGYDGDYLTCLSGESVLGIDVSSFQGNIDWEKVKNAGIDFVIIRAAGRGYGKSGVLYSDDLAQQNYRGAKAAGLKVGAYIFSQAITVEEAREEAEYLLQLTQDWELDMPLVFDWECEGENYRTYGLDPRTLTDCIQAFCRRVEEDGHTAMIYFNPSFHNTKFYIEELTGYQFWLAMYSDQMSYPYHIDMWQYTKTGRVPGISGDVDINLYLP